MPAPKTIIRLSVTKTLKNTVSPESGGNLLRLEVTEVENIESGIFVFQRDVESEFSPENLSLFYSIASVAQLSTLPLGEGNQDEPFFRLTILEAVFETALELENFYAKILAEIRQLQRANDVIIDPANAETFHVEVSGGLAVIIPPP